MSSKVYEALFQDIDRHMDEYMGELCDFLRIPGVCTSSARADATCTRRSAAS